MIEDLIRLNNKLLKENNKMLRFITEYLKHESLHDDREDFMLNIIANVIGNYIT